MPNKVQINKKTSNARHGTSLFVIIGFYNRSGSPPVRKPPIASHYNIDEEHMSKTRSDDHSFPTSLPLNKAKLVMLACWSSAWGRFLFSVEGKGD
jgi:hypothetical protein